MKIKHFVEKVEGETELEFDFKNGIVNNVNIVFPFYRGIEEILRDRDALDALVITLGCVEFVIMHIFWLVQGL